MTSLTQSPLHTLPFLDWHPPVNAAAHTQSVAALERGGVLYLPQLAFTMSAEEERFLSPAWSDGTTKNIYLRGHERVIRGANGTLADLAAMRAMIERYAAQATTLIHTLFPEYAAHLTPANTSFRPCEVEGRPSSWRKDDRRLHTDAFPSNPTHGMRILRVFSNVNPHGVPRVWRVGEPFQELARRYLPRVPRYHPLQATLLHALRITKRQRSEYDHIMLYLHDMVKADMAYQENGPQEKIEFPPGSTWVVFSDEVLHAAMAGQFMFEQTFHLPVKGLYDPTTSPLAILEEMTGRQLL